ncbi:Elicitin-like protein [Phytophthora cinnamomi]|uniref:Elicitin-like protein n=1 Tax=Phytophthora cinnamomi TaxID=4785 RepID=UPI003559381C|nr:Elicitin-like protein [Phytophthora cinnamomi]
MKIAILSALVLAGVGVSVTATQCDLTAIEAALSSGSSTKANMTASEEPCLEATGYNIFDISSFPTSAQAKKAQLSSACSALINIVNGQANVASQCTIEVNGTNVTYGHLISSFLNGKTGNESDSGSGSVEIPSASASGSTSGSVSKTASSNSTTTSDAATTALSFVTYGAIAAIAVALR